MTYRRFFYKKEACRRP